MCSCCFASRFSLAPCLFALMGHGLCREGEGWQEGMRKLQGLMQQLAEQLLRNAELACAELVTIKASPRDPPEQSAPDQQVMSLVAGPLPAAQASGRVSGVCAMP